LYVKCVCSDNDGFIYFNELPYKTMKRRYANGRTKKKVLYELELDTLEKLEKIMKQQMLLSRAKERKDAVAVNPFLAMMYKNMSFNVWRNIYCKKLKL
jgi:predicted lactoylglutathione lyase